VPAARAGDPPRADLALLRDVAAELVDVLPVDLVDLVLAEVAALALPGLARAAGARLPSRFLCLRCHISPLRTGCRRRRRSVRSRQSRPWRSPARTAARRRRR